jgi:hypothetical protein
MPGSKVRNAIYKAGVTEWDHIRKLMKREIYFCLLIKDLSCFQVSMVSGPP